MVGKIVAGVVGGLFAGLIAWFVVAIVTWHRLATTPLFQKGVPLAALLAFWGLGLVLALRAPRPGKAWRSVLGMCAMLFFAACPTAPLIESLLWHIFFFAYAILGVITLLVASAVGADQAQR